MALDVDVRTVTAWKQRHPDFAAACVVTDEEKLHAVTCSLYHRAVGYEHPATKIIPTSGGIFRVPYIKHYPPDVAAIKFYLCNRAPAEWRERAEPGSGSSEVVVRVLGGLPECEPEDSAQPRALSNAGEGH